MQKDVLSSPVESPTSMSLLEKERERSVIDKRRPEIDERRPQIEERRLQIEEQRLILQESKWQSYTIGNTPPAANSSAHSLQPL